MTHVMVPDGVFPWWLSTAGWLAAGILIALAMWRLRGVPTARMVPLVGVLTAVMVVIMSVEIVPIAYELHLTVLAGIILGPWYAAISALLFNLLRALIGDGAFTNIGLNTTIIWLEMALGWALFAAVRSLIGSRRPALAAGLATFVALMLTTFVFIGVIAASRIDPAEAIHTGSYSVEAGGFSDSALGEGFLSVHFGPEHEAEGAEASGVVGLAPFAIAMLVLGSIGWTIEALLTAAVVGFLARVRPELLGLRMAPEMAPEMTPAQDLRVG